MHYDIHKMTRFGKKILLEASKYNSSDYMTEKMFTKMHYDNTEVISAKYKNGAEKNT